MSFKVKPSAPELEKPRGIGARNPALDGIRGIAVSLVVLHHSFQDIQARSQLTSWISHIAVSCWIGVDLFFILSGYLITGILLESRDRAGYFRVFYGRRFLRIFPLYYAFMILMCAAVLLTRPSWAGVLDRGWNFLYLANLRVALHGWPWRPFGHLWSLSVEEQFYLIWPAVIFLVPRRWSFAAIVGAFCVFLGVRQAFGEIARNQTNVASAIYCLLHLDGLLLGSALATVPRWRLQAESMRKTAWFVFLLCGGILVAEAIHEGGLKWRGWHGGVSLLNYAVVAICGAALLAVSIGSEPGARVNRLFQSRPLVAAGKYSFCIYIVHYPLDTGLRIVHLHPSGILGTVPYTILLGAGCFAIAYCSWQFFEKRFIDLKDRWFVLEPLRTAASAGIGHAQRSGGASMTGGQYATGRR